MNSLLIANREYYFGSSIEEELYIDKTKSYLCALPHLSCISVIGEKSCDFLQGQLSCDITQVSDNTIAHGALCNLKGRIITLMDVIRCHDYQLLAPVDLFGIINKDLKTAAMLSRIQLHHSARYDVLGLVGCQSNSLLPKKYFIPHDQTMILESDFCHYKITNELSILLLPSAHSKKLCALHDMHKQLRHSLLWHYSYLKAGYFTIYPLSSAVFLPQKVSLHSLNYVNFKKGCYKGQEIIARMHFRSPAKHALRLFEIESTAPIRINDALYAPESTKVVAEVVDLCPMANNKTLIAASTLIDFTDFSRLQVSQPTPL